jgi:hypothetical protein
MVQNVDSDYWDAYRRYMSGESAPEVASGLAAIKTRIKNSYPELMGKNFTSIGEADAAIQRVEKARSEIRLPGYSGTIGKKLFDVWDAANSPNADPVDASLLKKAIADKTAQYRPGVPEWATFMGIADQTTQAIAE